MRKRGSHGIRIHTAATIAAVVFVLGSTQQGTAGLIPGGGKPASDCYAEFDVQGASGGNKVTCTDGDPCDTDGQCQGVCTFSMKVCINQTNVAGCSAKPFKRLGVPAFLPAPSTAGTGPVCGTSGTFALALRGQKSKQRRKKVKMTAIVTGKPSKEVDQLTLICRRRQGACPTTTTTTTTTTTIPRVTTSTTSTTTTSTTTTTLPEGCMLGPCPGFTQFTFSNTPGSPNCGGGALDPAPSAPFSGAIFSDTACTAKLADLGLSCLYLGGGDAFLTPPSRIPDGSTSIFEAQCLVSEPGKTCPSVGAPFGTLVASAGTSRANCTKGAGPGRHCIGPFNAGAACGSDNECSGPGSCALDANCFFGPPLPIPSPGTGLHTCTLNVIQTDATGTADFTTGESTVTIPLSSQVFLTGNADSPCPRCLNGKCNAGPNKDLDCTPVGTLQTTIDCPPNMANADFQGALTVILGPLTNGTTMKTAADGLFCPGQGSGTAGLAGAFGKSSNMGGVPTEPTARCIVETGTPSGNLTDLASHPATLASVFCIPATQSVTVNFAAGLPGPGAIGLNGTVKVQ